LNKFTIATVIGWVLGNVTQLYTLPGLQVDEQVKDLKKQLDELGQKALVENLKRDLKDRLFSLQFILINLFNLLVLVLILLVVVFKPARLFSWIIPEAAQWSFGASDRWVLGTIFVLQLLFFIGRGASPWLKGCMALRKAKAWLKTQ
jgi:hypothetical protein